MPTTKTIDDWIEGYQPPNASTEWELELAPFVRKIVRATPPTSPADAHKLMATLSTFVVWAVEQDIPLRAESLLTPERMDEYLARGVPSSWSYNTLVGARWAIRRVGRAATRQAAWRPNPPKPRNKAVTLPFTEAQIRDYCDAAEKQSTHARRHYMRAALAFHHGAGLHPSELRRHRGSDIEEVDGGVYVIRLTGDHTRASRAPARVTAIHTSYNEMVRALVAENPRGSVAAHSKEPTDAIMQALKGAIQLSSHLPPLTARRLRMTWLRDALNTAVPLKAVLTAAGLGSLDFEALSPTLVDSDPIGYLRSLAGSITQPHADCARTAA